MNKLVSTSYSPDDVILLLKDLTGKISPQSTKEREKAIQSGVNYSEMLPLEEPPSEEYFTLFEYALEKYSRKVAEAIGVLANRILKNRKKGIVLVSLARAGIPIGILLRRYFKQFYGLDVPHYAISIIRGKGIDSVAMNFLLNRFSAKSLVFVDGWTGKGAIKKELDEALSVYPGIISDLAVVADPAGITNLCGTREDLLIPSSCLNSTVSGLVSRTIHREDLIGKDDFHGAVCFKEFADQDVSYRFINSVEQYFAKVYKVPPINKVSFNGPAEVASLGLEFEIKDLNKIKPGIGETTRVLLRRVPWKVLVKDQSDFESIGHILTLAKEKCVPVEEYPLMNYKAVGIIKELADA